MVTWVMVSAESVSDFDPFSVQQLFGLCEAESGKEGILGWNLSFRCIVYTNLGQFGCKREAGRPRS